MIEGRLVHGGYEIEFVFGRIPREPIRFWSEPALDHFPLVLNDIRGQVVRMPVAFDATGYRFFAEPVGG